METNPTPQTTVVTFSQNVYHDWQSRGFISSLELDGHVIQTIKETKRDVTLSFDRELLAGFIYDLTYQIHIINTNGDGNYGARRMYERALEKFKAVVK